MRKRVVFSPTVPPAQPNNAGERYLNDLDKALGHWVTTYIVPATPANTETAAQRLDTRVVLVDARQPSSKLQRVAYHAAELIDRLLPSRPERAVAASLQADQRVVSALKEADLVDLQWPELAHLAGTIKRRLPGTRVLATMHDVHSQRFGRQLRQAQNRKARLRSWIGVQRARRMEQSISRSADAVLVFSDKDAALMPKGAKTFVVYPPLAGTAEIATSTPRLPFLLFVGPLHRRENLDALEYFVADVWPHVRGANPTVELLVAGRPPADPESPLRAVPGLRLLGFVPDLHDLYRGATAVIAPLRLGAGLKFKSIDALVRGIPLIGTPVAVEGIDTGTIGLESYDRPLEMASELVHLLEQDVPQRSAASAVWYRWRYGTEQFHTRIAAMYDEHTAKLEPGAEATAPAVSVVIPVKNGEFGLSDQLDCLARQVGAPTFEVVVADNGSTDRTVAVARAHAARFFDLRVIDASARKGVNFARNIGVLEARAQKVLICDHDDFVDENWVQGLAARLDDFELVGGKTIAVYREEDGSLRRSVQDEPALRESLGYMKYALGGNLGVRREAFLQARGFDESFVGGHDEVEFSWRMQREGARLGSADEAKLEYLQQASLKSSYRQAFHSSRTRLQLWARYHRYAPIGQVSYRGALHQLGLALLGTGSLARREHRIEAVRRWGRALGAASGHVRYRILGRVPDPVLLSPPERQESSDASS